MTNYAMPSSLSQERLKEILSSRGIRTNAEILKQIIIEAIFARIITELQRVSIIQLEVNNNSKQLTISTSINYEGNKQVLELQEEIKTAIRKIPGLESYDLKIEIHLDQTLNKFNNYR